MQREDFSKNKIGQREYLNKPMTTDLVRQLYCYLESKVAVSRIVHGARQTVETLISEEALLFAKYLRGERESWIPRIAIPKVS